MVCCYLFSLSFSDPLLAIFNTASQMSLFCSLSPQFNICSTSPRALLECLGWRHLYVHHLLDRPQRRDGFLLAAPFFCYIPPQKPISSKTVLSSLIFVVELGSHRSRRVTLWPLHCQKLIMYIKMKDAKTNYGPDHRLRHSISFFC